MAKKSNKLNKSNKSNKKVAEGGLFNWLNEPVKKPKEVNTSPNAKPVELTGLPAAPSWNTWGTPEFNEQAASLYQRPKPMTLDEPQYQVTTGTDVAPTSSAPDINQRLKNPFSGLKRNEAITLGLAGTDAFLRRNQAIADNYNYQKRLRNVFTQKPIYDYNYLYGPDASGGTQYQSLIMAKDGAQIRKGTSPLTTDVEVEGGEFIQLPDFSTQHVQGPSHAKGGVHTNLPEGTRVFSDFLKPMGSKKTYAQLAKKYDTQKWKTILDNPYANDIDRNTAKKMFDRNESILNELFQDQQIQNGNSDGTDQAAESMGMNPEMIAQMNQEEIMGKFGLDLKKGEKLSFTNPFEYGGEYEGGYAEFEDGGEYMEENYYIPNRSITYDEAVENDEDVEDREAMYGQMGMINPSWMLSQDQEQSFQQFYNTLPSNLKTDNNSYNIRGYWDALGRPLEFDYAQPKESDGYYHAFSRHPRTGMILKSPSHPTYQQAIQGDKAAGYSFALDPNGNVYSMSPEDMPTEGYFAEYQDGGMFPYDSTFYNNPQAPVYDNNGYYDVKGDASFQTGGLKGRKQVDYIRSSYQDKPEYPYQGADQTPAAAMKERLKLALQTWGLDSAENLKKVEDAKTVAELNKLAGTMQKKVATDSPEIAEDFGLKTAPTRAGFKYLAGLGDKELQNILKDARLVNLVKQAKAGSYSMTPQDREIISQRIRENLSTDKKKDYAKANFQDEEFYFRYPRVEKVEFDDEKEYEEYKKNINVGNKYVADPNKLGLYIQPVFKKPEDKAKETAKGEEEKKSEGIPPGNQFPNIPPFEQIPSTMGRFPAYQAAPNVLGFLSGMTPYTYYTPDYTHYEVAPPTLNIDSELQSIDDTVAAINSQSSGNPAIDNARRIATFNQGVQAKQQAFARKQNFDAEARFKADMYNTEARTKENYLDVNAAANVFNEYRAAAQDAAERERLSAIQNLTDKTAKFYQDEYTKMLAVSALMPQFYYEGKDLNNPLKFNPNARTYINSYWANVGRQNAQDAQNANQFTPSTSLPSAIAGIPSFGPRVTNQAYPPTPTRKINVGNFNVTYPDLLVNPEDFLTPSGSPFDQSFYSEDFLTLPEMPTSPRRRNEGSIR